MNPPVIPTPPGLWQTNRRPYFHTVNSPINTKLERDLPWNERSQVVDSKDSNTIAEEEGLKVGDLLGHGTFSAVHNGYWKQHRLNVPVKIYEKPGLNYLTKALPALRRMSSEVDSLKKLKHPNIVGFFGAMETKYRVYLILELVQKGNLLQYIKKMGAPGESNLAKKWFSELVSAMTFVHRLEIAHRDIKCENILLDSQLNIRLSDFGFAKANITWKEDVPNDDWVKIDEFCGSFAYMSPEILKKIPYCPILSDIWSSGIVLYGMIFGKFPYDEINVQNILDLPKRFIKFSGAVKVSPQLSEIFQSIFVAEGKRIRSYQLLEKAWLEEEIKPLFLGRMGHLDEGEAEKRLKTVNQKIPDVILEESA